MTTERQQSKINGCLGDGLSGRIHCVQYPLQVAVDSRINLLRIKILFLRQMYDSFCSPLVSPLSRTAADQS